MSAAHHVAVDRIRRIFRDALNIEVSMAETDLIDGGLLDSLSLVELLVAIEQEFQVSLALDDLDIENFRTLDRIGAFLVGRNGYGSAAA